MNKRQKIKTFFIILIATQLLLAHINLAYAQNSPSVTNPPVYSGVSSQIEQYLCAPTNTVGTDLFTCINKLYRFAIAAGSVVAILFIVIAGYRYMASDGNQETIDNAKSMFISSITAMVILFGGYVLLRALNPDLLRFQSIQPPSVVVTPGVTTPTTGAPAAGGAATVNAAICQAPSGLSCTNSACDQYNNAITAAAQKVSISGVDAASLIKAIMVNESSCKPGAASGANSYGLMQLQVDTANNSSYKSACGINVTVDSGWLTNPSNASQVICLGAQYLQTLSSSCSGVLNIAAGYNGGTKACAQSVDCTGTSCDGTNPMRAWECLYDDTAHNVPNTGYNESRNYAPKVLGCYQQFGPIR